MSPAGFEPATLEVKWPQIYALDSMATVIGGSQLSKSKYKQFSVTQQPTFHFDSSIFRYPPQHCGAEVSPTSYCL